MKKNIPIYLYGSIIILVGLFLLFSKTTPVLTIKTTIGVSLIVGAIFAFFTAFNRVRQQVQFNYHEMHALAMMVYGLSLLLLCNSYERLIAFTSFLFLFYAFSEIIFCNWLFNLGQKISFRIIALRAFLGLAIGLGTVVAINHTELTIQVFGILFILVGTNIIFYIPVMKADINK
jgi:uncharacterized membrane protein HdeD (DUF308 family)